jgi:queuine tRNA-ribosyltransferase
MPLDEFMPSKTSYEETKASMLRSHRWELRSLARFKETSEGKQALYGIIQGGVYEDLRRESADFTRENDFFGTAIGGSLGVTVDNVYDEVVRWSMENAHPDRPVHLLGIGTMRDVFAGVRYGVDTFDCVTPTRVARHGWALAKKTKGERLNLLNAKYKDDKTPLDPDSDFEASQFSRGYLHHLIKANEPLAAHIISRHNINVMTRLMADVRKALENGTLDALEAEWLEA